MLLFCDILTIKSCSLVNKSIIIQSCVVRKMQKEGIKLRFTPYLYAIKPEKARYR